MNVKHATAEAFGTFVLVLAGTAAIAVNDLYGGSIGHVGIALAFGAAVMIMIYAIGDISGAHMNPAVTVGGTVALMALIFGPFAGALLAVPACRLIGRDECCAGDC